MKRIFSLILALLMLIVSVPLTTTASEQEVSRHDYLIELACDTFPEYASIIRGQNTFSHASLHSDSNGVIFSETRTISDTETLNIAQLSSGNVIITKGNVSSFPIDIINENTSDISNVGVSGSATFEVTCSEGAGTFTLSNVRFTIYYTGSDFFTNTGSYSIDNNVSVALHETSTTLIHSHITFNMAGSFKPAVDFTLSFSNDQLVAEVR